MGRLDGVAVAVQNAVPQFRVVGACRAEITIAEVGGQPFAEPGGVHRDAVRGGSSAERARPVPPVVGGPGERETSPTVPTARDATVTPPRSGPRAPYSWVGAP